MVAYSTTEVLALGGVTTDVLILITLRASKMILIASIVNRSRSFIFLLGLRVKRQFAPLGLGILHLEGVRPQESLVQSAVVFRKDKNGLGVEVGVEREQVSQKRSRGFKRHLGSVECGDRGENVKGFSLRGI